MTEPFRHNFLLAIEGLDGSGKTDVSRRVARALRETLGDDLKLTFEPHDPSCAGLFIRQVLNRSIAPVPVRTLALAFAANRADHVDREINPFLAQADRRAVICDRYYLSSLVYQTAPDVPLDEVMLLNRTARQPDLTIFLDASTKTCYERMRRRPENKELFEKNLRETRQKYLHAIQFLRDRGEAIVEIDADKPLPDVVSDILDVLSSEAGPNWLTVQRPLPQDVLPEVFSLNGTPSLHLEDVARRHVEALSFKRLATEGEHAALVADLERFIQADVSQMHFNEVGSLFLDHLARIGYRVVDRLPWTDLDAFELACTLPMRIELRGSALLLNETQRYEIISKKMLDIERLSDFMIVLDPRAPAPPGYYERSVVKFMNGVDALSPSTRIITRDNLAEAVLDSALTMIDEAFPGRSSGQWGHPATHHHSSSDVPIRKQDMFCK